jgi:hypothetical protein
MVYGTPTVSRTSGQTSSTRDSSFVIGLAPTRFWRGDAQAHTWPRQTATTTKKEPTGAAAAKERGDRQQENKKGHPHGQQVVWRIPFAFPR